MEAILEGILYLGENLKLAVKWEISKYKSRGIHNFTALFLLYLFFTYIPQIIFYFYQFLPYTNRYYAYVIGSWTTHFVTITLIHTTFSFIYALKSPYLDSFRANSEKWPWQEKDWPVLRKKVFWNLVLQNFLIIPALSLITGLAVKYDHSYRLPTYSEFLPQMVFFQFAEDIWGYYSHRILHIGALYKTVHKTHHEFKVTSTLAAEYTHPAEFIFGNIASLTFGPFIYGQQHVHIITWFTWMMYRLSNSLEAHSGYTFPWAPGRVLPFTTNEDYHDFHHTKNVGTYTSYLLMWDVIFGNHIKYLEYRGLVSKKTS